MPDYLDQDSLGVDPANPTSSLKTRPPSQGRRPAANRRAIWVMRIVLGLALLIACKMAVDFLSSEYYEDAIAPVRQWPGIFWRFAGGLTFSRVAGLFHGSALRTRLVPRVRVAAFILSVWAFLLWAGAILFYEYVLAFARPLPASAVPRNRFAPYVWLRRFVLGATGVGVLCILYGFYVEPYWLEVTHVRLESQKLPRGAPSVRLVVISDLHMARKQRLEPRLPGAIAAQKPDLIVFLGDALNSSWAVGRFKQFMLNLHNIAPVVAVRGNQDDGPFWDSHNVYGGTAVTVLQNAAMLVNIRGAELYLWGQNYSPHLIPPQPPSPPGAFTILLEHGPDLMADAVRAHFDLYLAGHTHGGQVALPFYGALITYSRYDKKYESGLFHEGSTTLYVNRGIGLAHWPQTEARFCARPEITVIDLVSAPR